MKIAYNPLSSPALSTAPTGNDLIFDLPGINIYVRGVRFKGTDTTYNVFKKHTSSGVGGYNGLVPVPSFTTTIVRYLREDGTWQVPPDTLVKQSITTTSNFRAVVLGATNSTNPAELSTTVINQVYVNSGIYVQPSTATILASIFKGILRGNADSATYSSKLESRDIRATNLSPKERESKGTSAWFNSTGTPDSSWWGGLTIKGWSENYEVWELAGPATSINTSRGLYFRSGIADTWNAWERVLTSANTSLTTTANDIIIKINNVSATLPTLSATDGRYVKKTGDTLTGNLIFPSSVGIIQTTNITSNYATIIKWYLGDTKAPTGTNDAQIGWHNTGYSHGAITLLPYKTTNPPWDGTVGLYIAKNLLKLDNQPVLHSGNFTSYFGYIGTTRVQLSSATQALNGISSINGRFSVITAADLTKIGFGGVHNVEFGDSGYAHRVYYFRPAYSASGYTNTEVLILNASAATDPVWTTSHSFAANGNAIHSGSVTATRFNKADSSDSYVLLGGGGHKTLASFQTDYDARYVNKTGDTMTGILNMNLTRLRMVGAVANPVWDSPGAITWSSTNTDSQAVSLVYTDYDSYRAPSGLKLCGNQGQEWFEAPRFIRTGSNDNYLLLGGGGHILKGNASGNIPINNGVVNTNLNADLLDGTHLNSITDRVSLRDFPLGTLIRTSINYNITNGDPFVLELTGNTYGNLLPLDARFLGYIYSNTIINYGGTNAGFNLGAITALLLDGMLCFWFPNKGYWQGYTARCYVPTVDTANRITSITNTGDPGGSKRVIITPTKIAFITDNVASATILQNTRTLWGRPFNGSANVSGNLDSVGTINGSGILELNGVGEIYLKVNKDATKSVVLNTSSFKPFDTATNLINLGMPSARWKTMFGISADLTGSVTAGARSSFVRGLRAVIGSTDDWTTAAIFAAAQYPLVMYNPSASANTRKYYFAISANSLSLSSANDANGYVTSIADFSHNGVVQWYNQQRFNNRLVINSDGKVSPYSTDTRRSGMYGTYDSTKIGHIWSMGASYQIADDGSTFGNLYGLAYKHVNNMAGGTMGGGHQMVWVVSGVPRFSAGEYGIWTSGHIEANGNAYISGNVFAGRNRYNSGSVPTIDLAVGDSDTGIRWNSDGNISLMANGVSVANIFSTGFTTSVPITAPSFVGNITSATKLQTPRAIFGKLFDGTADVSGKGTFYGSVSNGINGYNTGALEIREANMAGIGNVTDAAAPRIGFHWGNRFGRSIISSTDGFKFQELTESTLARVHAGKFTSHNNFNNTDTWVNVLTSGANYDVPLQNVYVGQSQNILSWGNILAGVGYVTRYTIGSARLGNSFGRMIFSIGKADNSTTGAQWHMNTDGSFHSMHGVLRTTTFDNTLSIGSDNVHYTHFTNSARRPFWFSDGVIVNGDVTPYLQTGGNCGTEANRWATVQSSEYYATGWFRNRSSDTGLYNHAHSIHIRARSGHWYMDTGLNVGSYGTVDGVLSSGSRIYTGYDANVAGGISCSNWFRNSGAGGWLNATYGGGWHMTDTDSVKVYGDKVVYNDGFRGWGIGGHHCGLKLYQASHIGLNLANNSFTWGIYSNNDGNMYFGRRDGNVDDTSGSYVMRLGVTALHMYGNVVANKFVRNGGNSWQLLRADGGVATFNWKGNAGQPLWLWGGLNDGSQHSYELWNPSHFKVESARYLLVADIRDTNPSPKNKLSNSISSWFNMTGTPNASWWSGISVAGWNTEYERWELAGPATASNTQRNLHYRSGHDDTWGVWKTILDSSNWSSITDGRYLPLTGGTISGTLSINSAVVHPLSISAGGMGNKNYIKYTNGAVVLGYIGVSGVNVPSFKNASNSEYTLWHSGNDGAGSGLDADMIHGNTWRNLYIPTGYFGEITGTVLSKKNELVNYFNVPTNGIGRNATVSTSLIVNWNSDSATLFASSAHTFIKLSGGYSGSQYAQFLLSSYSYNELGVVGRDNHAWTNIRWLAYKDSNVASATQLATARSIWGQSFNGTADITGRAFIDNRLGGAPTISLAIGDNDTGFDWESDSKIRLIANGVNLGYWNTAEFYIHRDVYASNLRAHGGYLFSTTSGHTILIGSLNGSYCHYSTGAPNHWFNKSVMVAGNIYGGTNYNRRLAYVDEINSQVGGSKSALMYWFSWGTGTYDGAIQIRETSNVGTAQSAWGYSPALTFHWGNRHAKRFGMRSDGQFAIDDIPLSLSNHTHAYVPLRTRADYNDNTVINNVIGQLAWKHYGNNHTIFDASNGTTPSGTACNNTNSQAVWTATYPTLMGWNGNTTYGVRVDRARLADNATYATNADYASSAGYAREVTTGFRASGTNTWNCNAPDRIAYSDYGSSGRSISNAPSGWNYGSLINLGNSFVNGLNGHLTLLLMWDIAHNSTNGGTLWFRGRDSIYGWAKNWCKVLTDQNYTSTLDTRYYTKTIADSKYVTSLSTSGNSLTWVRNGTTNNITVPYASNAGLLAGLAVHSSRNNEANKVVRTDVNGYLNVGYINSSNGHERNSVNPTFVWGSNSSDSYLRSYYTSGLNVAHANTANTANRATNADYAADAANATNAGYARTAEKAGYLSTNFGSKTSNPQLYFNSNIGVKIGMTGHNVAPVDYADTLWLNGSSLVTAHNNCNALHFSRLAPDFYISQLASNATSYGTSYRIWSLYNSGTASTPWTCSSLSAANINCSNLITTDKLNCNVFRQITNAFGFPRVGVIIFVCYIRVSISSAASAITIGYNPFNLSTTMLNHSKAPNPELNKGIILSFPTANNPYFSNGSLRLPHSHDVGNISISAIGARENGNCAYVSYESTHAWLARFMVADDATTNDGLIYVTFTYFGNSFW